MLEYENKLQQHKDKILENINKGKLMGVNKVTAIIALEDQYKSEIENDLVTWLKEEKYNVSIIDEELKILIIEW